MNQKGVTKNNHKTLFKHKKDQRQYRQIYNVLQDKFRQYPKLILNEIAEFAVGLIKLCTKSSCKEEIIILYAEQEEYISSTPPHSKATQLRFKYCPVLKIYWCNNHMHQIIQDQWCPNRGLFDSELRQHERCNDCNGSYLCHDKCSRLMMGSCAQCNKKREACRKCRFTEGRNAWGACIGCGIQYCKKCLIQINIGKGEEEVCKDCFNGVEVCCDKCNNKAILGYKGKCVQEKYIRNKWSICIDGKCMAWVCLHCSNNGICCNCEI